MARASSLTSVPIDTWAKLMGVSPWEFNQIGGNLPTNADNTCESVFFQHAWQAGFISREEIGQALFMAEQAIADEIGYFVGPTQCSDIVVNNRFGPDYRSRDFRNSWSAQLNWKRIISPGIIKYDPITVNVPVVYSDTVGDGINDRFTVTFTTDVIDTNEIVLVYNATDRHNAAVDMSWEIRPVHVVITSGTAVVHGHASLMVAPDYAEMAAPDVLDVDDSTIYITSVDAYRKYVDYTATTTSPNQGVAIWDGEEYCSTGDMYPVTAPIRLQYGAADMGVVNVNLAQPSYTAPSADPTRFRIHYVSGVPLVNNTVHPHYADIVVHLATALLPAEPCGCARTNQIVEHWRNDPENIPNSAFDNPFGTSRGAIYAWNRLKPLVRMGAVVI